MILEFVGLPGAGKSTHLPPLIKVLEEYYIKGNDFTLHHKKTMSSMLGRLSFLFFLLFNVNRTFRLLRVIKASNTLKKKTVDRLLPLLTMLHSIRRFQASHPDSVLIMDQGIIQLVCSIYHRIGTPSDDERINTTIALCMGFIGGSKASYNTVLFRLPTHVAQQRIRTRGKKGCEFGDMEDGNLLQALSYYETFFKNMPSTLTVDAEGDIGGNITLIYKTLID